DSERGTPVSGVTISDGLGHTVFTDANGNYTLEGLAAGTYTIIASKASYTFLVAVRPVTVPPVATGVNFVGIAIPPGTFTISGRVLDSLREAPVSGVTISDGAGHTATTDTNGNYLLNGVAPGGYTVTASKSGYSSITRQVSVPPNAIGQNFLLRANDPSNAS